MMSNQTLRPTEAAEADAHTVTDHNECVWPSLDDKNPFAVLSTDDVCESDSEHSEDVPGHVEDTSEPSDEANEHEHEHDVTCKRCYRDIARNQLRQLCQCRRCWRCNNMQDDCDCGDDTCAVCDQPDSFCSCPRCHICGEEGYYCECQFCGRCNSAPTSCRCVIPSDKKTDLTLGRLLQQVDTLGIEYDNWSPRPVVVYSNFEEHYLFAIRKPFIIYQDIKNKIKSVLESQLDVLRGSRLYKGIIKSINTVKFLRELEHEASRTNVTTKNGVRKMLTELVKLPADGQSMVLSFDCEGDNLGRHGTTCYLQIRDNVAERI